MMPCCLEARAEVVVGSDPDEVARRRGRVEAGRDERGAHALALGDLRVEVVARVAERRGGDARRGGGDRSRRAARLEHGGRRGRRDGIADAERRRSRTPSTSSAGRSGSGTRRATGRPISPPYSTYASSTTTAALGCRRASSTSSAAGVHLPGRVVRVAAPDQARAVRPRADRSAPCEQRRDAVERVGRRDDRRRAAGREVRARAEQDEVVRAGADDDLLPADVGAALARDVRGRGLAQLAVEARRGTGSASRSSPRAGPARTPGSGGVFWSNFSTWPARARGAPRPPPPSPPRRTARKPSGSGTASVLRPAVARLVDRVAASLTRALQERARRRPRGAAAPRPARSGRSHAPRPRRRAGVARTTWSGFMNISSPSPPEERARPPVGRTCVAPAA